MEAYFEIFKNIKTKKYRGYTMPNGKKATSDQEYYAVWAEASDWLKAHLNCGMIGYDPDFLLRPFDNEFGGGCCNMPMWLYRRLREAVEPGYFEDDV